MVHLHRLLHLVMAKRMKFKQNFIPENAKCSTHHGFDNGRANVITIHWIGPYPEQTPEQVRDWWIKSNGEASAHYIIKDEECLQCWPLDVVAWHAGCRAGNYTSIGIEVIPRNKEGEFSDSSINTLKELLSTLPRLPIVRHYDWTGKDCPKWYCATDKWECLLKQLGR